MAIPKEIENIILSAGVICNWHYMEDPTCCGVCHYRNMTETLDTRDIQTKMNITRHEMSFIHKINGLYMTHSVEALAKEFPEFYQKAYSKWKTKVGQDLKGARGEHNKANMILYFYKDPEWEGYYCGILREVIKAWPGAVDFGEYKNPNTGNIINGFMVPTKEDSRIKE
jgi:hypothetical protein